MLVLACRPRDVVTLTPAPAPCAAAGGHAEQVTKRAALNPALAASSPLRGDVLRACTATNIVYQPAALAFGAQLPKRTIVVYGADGQVGGLGWAGCSASLGPAAGSVSCGSRRGRGVHAARE